MNIVALHSLHQRWEPPCAPWALETSSFHQGEPLWGPRVLIFLILAGTCWALITRGSLQPPRLPVLPSCLSSAPPRSSSRDPGGDPGRLQSRSPPARGSGRLPLPASTCCSVTSGGRKPGALSPRPSARGSLSHCVGDERSAGFEPSTCSVRSHHGQAPPRTPAPARQHPPERSALPAQKRPQSGFRRRADPSPVIMPPRPLQLPSLLIRCRFHKLRFSSTNI